jgi:hypothetical protein
VDDLIEFVLLQRKHFAAFAALQFFGSCRTECVAKFLAVLRTRNHRIQLNGAFESTLRACARPCINIARSGRENSFATHSAAKRTHGGRFPHVRL